MSAIADREERHGGERLDARRLLQQAILPPPHIRRVEAVRREGSSAHREGLQLSRCTSITPNRTHHRQPERGDNEENRGSHEPFAGSG